MLWQWLYKRFRKKSSSVWLPVYFTFLKKENIIMREIKEWLVCICVIDDIQLVCLMSVCHWWHSISLFNVSLVIDDIQSVCLMSVCHWWHSISLFNVSLVIDDIQSVCLMSVCHWWHSISLFNVSLVIDDIQLVCLMSVLL
jgi:hypothetical protein